MKAFGLKQQEQGPMDRLENTLNLIFTQIEREVKVINTAMHGYISNHCMVSITPHLHKTRYPKIEKMIRDKTIITREALQNNVKATTIDHNDSLNQACHWFNTELINALNMIAAQNNQVLKQT